MSRNPFARCNARHLRIMRSIPFIFADAVCNNALTHCAALSCRTLRRVARMCSSMVSDTANMRIHGAQSASRREEKSSAVPLFRSGHRSPICTRLSNKGKGRSSKRKENRRLSFLFAPAAGAANPRAPQSATPRAPQTVSAGKIKGRTTKVRPFPYSASCR